MIPLEAIKNFFPAALRDNALASKHLLKEYIQLMILDYLSSTPYIRKLTFIGGTCIRLTKAIDRFSEDLDFDIKALSQEEFTKMTDDVIKFLQNNGLHALAKDRLNPKLKAFRRNIHFPELLFDLGLSGHKEERFLIKIESQDQLVHYQSDMINIKGGGFYFPMPVPSDAVLCAMKVSAMLDRKKGRDFYDAMFLLSQTMPDSKQNFYSNFT
ncbi:MAG: nucleotidyl transferase AbiEii/AbiGii toxin family protein [Bacteroidota bacterium]|nr:nucleotidyl transferase AbiEii/AbiGii toxin family protein [Bacteroidota bacterium]